MTELDLYPGPGFNGLLMVASGGMPVGIDNIWAESSSPVADTLADAVRIARDYDLFRRLHSALMDMDLLVALARDLVAANEDRRKEFDDTADGDVSPASPLRLHQEALEVGMVTMYARHFTGKRRVPGKWEPKGKRKSAHLKLMDRRNQVVAHMEHTETRVLVNPNAELGQPGNVVMERREPIWDDDLAEYLHHFERMYVRYWDAVLQLKWDLGIGAFGELHDPSEYDE